MPTFRQPEWQQPADRHTEIVDPVLTVRQLSRFEFNLKSYVRIDHALVFATGKGGYVAYLPPQRPTRGDIATNRYTAVYEVDMGVHPHTCELALPSDNDAFEFTAAVDLSWQVLDPVRFVASGHRDVPGLLLGELQQAARPVTRRFTIADSASAEVELLERMNLLGPLGAPAGLQVTWTLRLKRDEANIEHELRKQAIEHSADEQIRAAQRGMEIDVEVDRRHRQSDSLQLDRAMQYGTHQQELLLQQQRWQHAQALLAGQQQLELQRLEEEKINFYQFHLQQGGVHQWALHLAQHPEDSHMVMNSMREDQLRMIQAQMELVQQLLNGDTAENWELEGPKQLALRTVNDILTQRLPGVPQPPPPPLPPGAGPEYPGTTIPGDPVPPSPGNTIPGTAMPPTPGTQPTDGYGFGDGQGAYGPGPAAGLGPGTATGGYGGGQAPAPGGYAGGPGAVPGAYGGGQAPVLGGYAGGPGAAPGAYGGGQGPAPGTSTAGQGAAPGGYPGGPGATPGPYAGGQTSAPGAYVPGQLPAPGPYGPPGQPPAAGPYGPGQSPATEAHGPVQAAKTGPYGTGHAPGPGPHAPGQASASGPYGPGQAPAPSAYAPGQSSAPSPYAPGQAPPSGPYPSGPHPGDPYPSGSHPSGPYPSGSHPNGPYPSGSHPSSPHPGTPTAAPAQAGPDVQRTALARPAESDIPSTALARPAEPDVPGTAPAPAPGAVAREPGDRDSLGAPDVSGWEPPPGYGRTPTLPARELSDAGAEEGADGAEGDGV
ncbi:hypothetical protein ACIQPR_35725 [Streptomyces sp. NPDC091280]|uniref:hypothetical protein n=1 Tax=Streptomyces sp. NPDC091280 TaxID=3365984 RepID=UPI00382700B3